MLCGAFQASSWQCNLVADGQSGRTHDLHVSFLNLSTKCICKMEVFCFQGLASLVSMAMAELYLQKISL